MGSGRRGGRWGVALGVAIAIAINERDRVAVDDNAHEGVRAAARLGLARVNGCLPEAGRGWHRREA